MEAQWPTLALYWHAPSAAGSVADPIFGRPLNFYLFTLPAWQLMTGWLLTLAIISASWPRCFCWSVAERGRWADGSSGSVPLPWRGLSLCGGFLLLVLALRMLYQPLRAAV